MNDYTTTCPKCSEKFVPRFTLRDSGEGDTIVRSKSFTSNSLHRKHQSLPVLDLISPASLKTTSKKRAALHCEYLSPLVLKKEMQRVLESKGVRYIQSDEFRAKSKTLFWNLVWHFVDHRLPVFFLLPAIVKSQNDGKNNNTQTKPSSNPSNPIAPSTGEEGGRPSDSPRGSGTNGSSGSSLKLSPRSKAGFSIRIVPPGSRR
eukprot:CAMPEP_0167775356 /NCGR_PEP_ID=MMETSP0111_2-20121227/2511_1 /TAXON_ID=91324 /ORGANISM="Lotharella globosa, Strain CCCM811" /LENGTH=202 /DNA_ID=CAMNT_0007665257 /DNA_START=87 /DNA_END=692 /DNA_ORIENTATION=-